MTKIQDVQRANVNRELKTVARLMKRIERMQPSLALRKLEAIRNILERIKL